MNSDQSAERPLTGRRSTGKKARSGAELALPRAPVRAAGRERYARLVDAVEILLRERSPGQIGLYDIAASAGVPPASVYHFFPSPAAGFIALAERFLREFELILRDPLEPGALLGWRDLYQIKARRIRDFYLEHPAAMKLFFGFDTSKQIRQSDLESNRNYAGIIAELYLSYFAMPDIPNLREIVEIAVTVNDAVWSLSFARHGTITEEMAVEAGRAYDAYLRNYLPELIPLRAGGIDGSAVDGS